MCLRVCPILPNSHFRTTILGQCPSGGEGTQTRTDADGRCFLLVESGKKNRIDAEEDCINRGNALADEAGRLANVDTEHAQVRQALL